MRDGKLKLQLMERSFSVREPGGGHFVPPTPCISKIILSSFMVCKASELIYFDKHVSVMTSRNSHSSNCPPSWILKIFEISQNISKIDSKYQEKNVRIQEM